MDLFGEMPHLRGGYDIIFEMFFLKYLIPEWCLGKIKIVYRKNL